MTRPVPWSMQHDRPIRAAGWMSAPVRRWAISATMSGTSGCPSAVGEQEADDLVGERRYAPAVEQAMEGGGLVLGDVGGERGEVDRVARRVIAGTARQIAGTVAHWIAGRSVGTGGTGGHREWHRVRVRTGRRRGGRGMRAARAAEAR